MSTTDIDWTDAKARSIREQLDKLLQSNLFDKSGRQSRFLKYIVEEELAGRGSRVSQYGLATDVFDRDATFDPLVDSIVRVEARRLRSKLAEYYLEQGPSDPIVLKLPKGRYRISVLGNSHDETWCVQPTTSTTNRVTRSTPNFVEDTSLAEVAEKPTIAVLPFDNLSGDSEQDYFCDGITEDIITDLSKISGLSVISRHSTFVYKGQSLNCREISDDLGANYVLEGSVRRVGDQVRISAQLIDATTDNHLGSCRK